MNGIGRARAAAIVTCTAASLGAGVTAGATKTVSVASKISISGRGLTFRGRVTTKRLACARARKVTLLRTNGLKLGTTTTDATGHWKIAVSGSAGISLARFYAKVRQRSEGATGTIYVCKGARSRTIPFRQ